ncbi:hypothetical protein LOC67_23480 [Stieleria sp. JC731]|uniref:hypothetical protein n=1 Tax=Pirellulaceae TaxID=2691357 RepID=UPI001E4EA962|nr:hypothetical protein [Stieleria sp. JC731]MCC9603522.1 hypothetical protein [Stieleria sp. JC731]
MLTIPMIVGGIAVLLFFLVVIGVAVMIVRNAGKRRYGGRDKEPKQVTVDLPHEGCNCNQPAQNHCIPATVCSPPVASPIALEGLSCDPNDPTHVYAGDVQEWIKAMNEQKSMTRRTESLARMREALEYMESYE